MISRTHQTLSSHIERENTKMIKMKGPMCCVACEVKNMLWRSKKKAINVKDDEVEVSTCCANIPSELRKTKFII